MSLVNAESGELIAAMTPDEARTITERIQTALGVAWGLVTDAYERRAWAALGYPSWDIYCAAEFGACRIKLPAEERQEVVASLRASGLSTRAIAAAVGVSDGTVRNDLLAATAQDYAVATPHPSVEDDGPAPVEPPDEGEAAPGPEPSSQDPAPTEPKITGTNGKSYSPKPANPPKPRRSSLPDAAEKAGWELRKAVERLERIAADDRFPANREQVAAALRGHLTYATEVLPDLLRGLDTDPTEDR